jgi:hypothetical protein
MRHFQDNTPAMTSVFVSHSSLDYDLVDALIIKPLQEHGMEVWKDVFTWNLSTRSLYGKK